MEHGNKHTSTSRLHSHKEPTVASTPLYTHPTNDHTNNKSDSVASSYPNKITTSSSTRQRAQQTRSMFNFGKKSKTRASADNEAGTTQQIAADGKTLDCNRTKTFDSFVNRDQLAVAGEQQKVGHTAQLKRGLGKVFGLHKKEKKSDQNAASGDRTTTGSKRAP